MNKRILVCMFTIGMSHIMLGSYEVFASAPSFRQLILPLNCQYEIINDGHGTIRYLTPKECGQVLPPPVNDNPQVPSLDDSENPSAASGYRQASPILLPPSLDTESRKKLYDTFWQPTVSPVDASKKTSVTTTPAEVQSAVTALAAVGSGFIILAVVIIFII